MTKYILEQQHKRTLSVCYSEKWSRSNKFKTEEEVRIAIKTLSNPANIWKYRIVFPDGKIENQF